MPKTHKTTTEHDRDAPRSTAGANHIESEAGAMPAAVASPQAGARDVAGATGTSGLADNPVTEGLSAAFIAEARRLLEQERSNYLRQAEELKAAADSLALDHEPGDVLFDEEGGEGGTANVDRELDLLLSAQARSAVAEIDRALAKIEAGTYGRCERCGRPIPQARLEALPHAALCVSCKSGGLSSRR